MKQHIKWIIRITAVVIVFCFPVLVHAQNPGCDPNTGIGCVPIDGGLSFLIAAGVGYGIKKVRDSRKKDEAGV